MYKKYMQAGGGGEGTMGQKRQCDDVIKRNGKNCLKQEKNRDRQEETISIREGKKGWT